MPKGQLYRGFAICIWFQGYIYLKIINYSFKCLSLIAMFYSSVLHIIYVLCVYFCIISPASDQCWGGAYSFENNVSGGLLGCLCLLHNHKSWGFVHLHYTKLKRLVLTLCILKQPFLNYLADPYVGGWVVKGPATCFLKVRVSETSLPGLGFADLYCLL